MALACNATDHQCSHAHEPREDSANELDRRSDGGANSNQKVLVEDEEGLNRTNASARVLDHEISVLELGLKRVFDELVVTEVLSFVAERPRPMLAMRELTTGKNSDLSRLLHLLRRSIAIAPRLEEFNLTQSHACHPRPIFVDNPGAGSQFPIGTRD